MNELADRFETAVRLATEAGALALRLRPPPGASTATLKGAQDWLTEADGAVERLLSELLASAYSNDGFQGEEGGRVRSGSLRWVVDPIDGTANFMRGGKRFCVSLGCLDGDVPVIGVIVAPALGETVMFQVASALEAMAPGSTPPARASGAEAGHEEEDRV